MLCSKLKSILSKQGGNGKEDTDSLMSKYSNVNEEYKQAFRTKSYLEIFDKVQQHLVRTQEQPAASLSPRRPPSSPPPIENFHLFEHLLEPHQETLTTNSIIYDRRSNFHQFLANYFEITLEACKICESLLTNIHIIRHNHRGIKKVIKLINRLPDLSNMSDEESHVLYKNLASFASRRNPLSTMSSDKFDELHETHVVLFHDLTSKCRKISRRKKIIRIMKRVISGFLVMGCGALAVAVIILAMHCIIGLAALPGLVMWALMANEMKRAGQRCSEKRLDGAAAQLDMAARGVYIMINDFATMSRAVKRLKDEVERRRYLAEECVRKGKKEMVKKVVGEFREHESWFGEQLDELEKQIYLCFLDINRSRRLIGREMFEL